MLEHLQLVVGSRNQFARACSGPRWHAPTSLWSRQGRSSYRYVRAHFGHVAFHRAHFRGHSAKLLLGGFFIGLQAFLRGMLFSLERGSLLAQVFLREARLPRQHADGGLHLRVGIRHLLDEFFLHRTCFFSMSFMRFCADGP